MFGGSLDGNMPLRTLTQEPGLSVSHFSRAFRKSAGMPPHHWLLHRRVEAAKSMLRDRRLPPAAVAIATGFADQGPFTRVFLRSVGVSPGVWQRNLLG